MSKITHLWQLLAIAMLFSLTGALASPSPDDISAWLEVKAQHFGGKAIRENANDLLKITAPKRAEDAATVPISIKSMTPQTGDKYIKNLHIVVDNNPEPYSAKFRLSPALGSVDIATRLRLEQYTFVRAIAEMNDGSLHMVSRFVKASGGCSAPIMKDAATAEKLLGKMKIRMKQPAVGEAVQTQVMISHPNYNGLQYNQQFRKYINAHYVKNIDIRYNGESLINVDTGISISQDPSIRFTFVPDEAGTLSAEVIDSKTQKFSLERRI